ncbi:MAG: shikimate kinase [Syntrophobacteraceae bacterium]
MKIFLVGVSCVGKTTIGKHLADRIEYQFIDFDEEIERYFLMPISRIKARFFSEHSFRAEASKILKRIIEQTGDHVVAMPPSGLMDSYWKILKKSDSIIIVLKDRPENILDRITFFDDDSMPVRKELTPKERVHYLKDIKKDMTYFGKSYSRAQHTVDIAGLGIEGSVGKIINCLQEKPEILTI